MTVSTVNSEYGLSGIPSRTNSTRNTGELGKDDFLKLLITQLKYQDPLQPMEDKEFIAQMAQFSSLEQMRNMNASIESMKGYNLIGKMVYAAYHDESTGQLRTVEGEVEGVRIISGNVYVTVDNEDVPVDKVQEVKGFNEMVVQLTQMNMLEQVARLNTSLDTMKGYDLIGKAVRAALTGDDGRTGTVEGIVSEVTVIDGVVHLMVGDSFVPLENVEKVFLGEGSGPEEDI